MTNNSTGMSWKRTIRPAVDRVAKYSGFLSARERQMRSKLTLLMYHRVLSDAECRDYPFASLALPLSLFEAQLDWLAANAQVVLVSDALSGRAPRTGSKPQVCLTFDDGYVDNFELVAPALEDRGLRGTFYITAGAVEARQPLWYDRAAEVWTLLGPDGIRRKLESRMLADDLALETRESWVHSLKLIPNARRQSIMDAFEGDGESDCLLMTPEEVERLALAGHEIGSHTLSHPILTTMSAQERKNEIEAARGLLRAWTRQEVSGFCYPNGDCDEEVIRQVREAGHSYACTTRSGLNDASTDRFQLRRIDITSARVAGTDGAFDSLGFRSEIALVRQELRRWTGARR